MYADYKVLKKISKELNKPRISKIKHIENIYPKIIANRSKPGQSLYFFVYDNIQVRNATVFFYYRQKAIISYPKNFLRRLIEQDLFNVFFPNHHKEFLNDMIWASKKYALETSYYEHLEEENE